MSDPVPERAQRAQLDGSVITGWDSFHDQSASVFGFPAFYGRNMNAWIDCLTYVREGDGMSRFRLGPEAPLVIDVLNSKAFKRNAPEVFEAFLDCVAFVNGRQAGAGELPALHVVLLP